MDVYLNYYSSEYSTNHNSEEITNIAKIGIVTAGLKSLKKRVKNPTAVTPKAGGIGSSRGTRDTNDTNESRIIINVLENIVKPNNEARSHSLGLQLKPGTHNVNSMETPKFPLKPRRLFEIRNLLVLDYLKSI